MLANGVKETTATAGTGTVTLAAATGFVRFSQAFAVGDIVSYAIRDGNNWEWGIGTVGASNALERTICNAKFDAGSYVTDGSKLSLSGSAEVFCDLHKASANELAINDAAYCKVDSSSFPRYAGDVSGTSLGAFSVTGGRTYYVPFQVPRRVTLSAIGINVTTAAAGLASAGIYANVRAAGIDKPGSLLVSASGLDTGTTGNKVGSVSITLLPGITYWGAVKVENASVSVRGIATASRDISLGRLADGNANVTALVENGSGSTLPNPAGTTTTLAGTTAGMLMQEAA